MKHSPVTDIYSGYNFLTKSQKRKLIKITLDVFEKTPINKRPNPSSLVQMLSKNKLKTLKKKTPK